MKKLLIVAIVLFLILISFNISLTVSKRKSCDAFNTEVIKTDIPNFAVIVDDDAQECYIVVVLDVIDKGESVVIVTSSKDIEAAKEEVIFCKTYSEADVWLELVGGLNG
jgi:hypothetical protein